jgi:acetyltransferase-like isoleucine patch superfamily enzyme
MKKYIRRIILITALIITLPLIVLTWLEKWIEYHVIKKRRGLIFIGCREFLSIIPSVIGNYIRLAYYWAVCDDVSPDANILFGTVLGHREVKIGAGVNTGPFSIIGMAKIGENTIFAARVSIISGKYQHGRPDERANGESTELTEENNIVTIGRNCWVGQDTTILANVGDNCTVGAGSVVFKDVPDNTTVLGNPARKVNL